MSTKTLDSYKFDKYGQLSETYQELLKGPITIQYNATDSIELGNGQQTLSDFNLVLIATQTDNPGLTVEELALVEVKIRDINKVSRMVTYSELQTIVALGASLGNSYWNNKVDKQEAAMSIFVDEINYFTEEEAIAAVEAITW